MQQQKTSVYLSGTYFVPYAVQKDESLPPPKWRVKGDQLSSHVYQTIGQVGNSQATFSGVSLATELAKQSGDYMGTVMAPSTLRNGIDSINYKIDALVETVKRLEQSNQILWRRLTTNDDEVLPLRPPPPPEGIFVSTRSPQSPQHSIRLDNCADKYPVHLLEPLSSQPKAQQMNIPCVRVTGTSEGSPVSYIPRSNRAEFVTTNYHYSPTMEDVSRTLGTAVSEPQQPSILSYTAPGYPIDVLCRTSNPSTPIEKESVSMMPLVDGPITYSGDPSPQPTTSKHSFRSVSVGTSTINDNERLLPPSQRDNSRGYFKPNESGKTSRISKMHDFLVKMQEADVPKSHEEGSENLMRNDLTSRAGNRCNHRQSTAVSKVSSDSDYHGECEPPAQYGCVFRQKTPRQPPPKLTKRQLWNIESVSSSGTETCSPNGSCPIPYHTGGQRRNPSAPSRTPNHPGGPPSVAYGSPYQPRGIGGSAAKSMSTPRNPQLLVEKDAVAQAKSMILMVLEELINTESSYVHTLSQFLILRDEIFSPSWRIDRQKVIRLFPAAVDDLYNLHKEAFESMRRAFDRTADEFHTQDVEPEYHASGPTNRRGLSAPYDERGAAAEGFNGASTPFTVLLELIEGKRPLSYYAHTNCTPYHKNAPLWSVAPFFKLYTRYLAEFSGAMQMLNKMRKGPSSLRKHLKQLQMHPACEFNDITNYLLAPVQRLPRYLLLVKKMIHYTQKMEAAAPATLPPKRHRPKPGLRRTLYPPNGQQLSSNSPIGTPDGFPPFETLKKAEAALHAMLLELDEMIGSEMVDFKSGAARGLKVTPSYSNNCSDSVDGNSTSNAPDLKSPLKNGGGKIEGEGTDGKIKPSLFTTTEKKPNESHSVSGGSFWRRLKRLRLTFTSKEPHDPIASPGTPLSPKSVLSTPLKLDDVGAIDSLMLQQTRRPGPQPTPASTLDGGGSSRRPLSRPLHTQGLTTSPGRAKTIKDESSEKKMTSWRRSSSARPLGRSVLNNPTTASEDSRRDQLQGKHEKELDKLSKEIARPSANQEQGLSSTERLRERVFSTKTFYSKSTLALKPIDPRPRPQERKPGSTVASESQETPMVPPKSDSDSGINMPEDDGYGGSARRQRPSYLMRQPQQSLHYPRERLIYQTVHSSRWQPPCRPSHTGVSGEIMQRPRTQRAYSGRSASPTISHSSSIAEDDVAVESACSSSSSTSYSLSKVDPTLRKRMSATFKSQTAPAVRKASTTTSYSGAAPQKVPPNVPVCSPNMTFGDDSIMKDDDGVIDTSTDAVGVCTHNTQQQKTHCDPDTDFEDYEEEMGGNTNERFPSKNSGTNCTPFRDSVAVEDSDGVEFEPIIGRLRLEDLEQ